MTVEYVYQSFIFNTFISISFLIITKEEKLASTKKNQQNF